MVGGPRVKKGKNHCFKSQPGSSERGLRKAVPVLVEGGRKRAARAKVSNI